MIRRGALAAVILAAVAAPAHADVISVDDRGFVIERRVSSAAAPAATWARLVRPGLWWSSNHSWSGRAANMTLDPRAGGCFCERWKGGEAEHGRVLQAVPGKLLRLSAPLGPMQSMGVSAVLTFELTPVGAGTEIRLRYIVGGNFGMDPRVLAPIVDGVLAEQLSGLVKIDG
jgi:uncharacterized protein YndB with AHSA1/START domain